VQTKNCPQANKGLEFLQIVIKQKEDFINEISIDIENANYDEKTEKE
jgi:hypothetical protein